MFLDDEFDEHIDNKKITVILLSNLQARGKYNAHIKVPVAKCVTK